MNKFFSAKRISYLAVFSSLIIVLQFALGAVRIGPAEFTFCLIPIILGAILLDEYCGLILGIIFGVITIISGITGGSIFTYTLLQYHPILTILTCLIKGALTGYIPGIIYKVLFKQNKRLAVIIATVSAPIINTGIFIIGGLFMSEGLKSLGGENTIYFLTIVCAGWNFIFELAFNVILLPCLVTIVRLFEKNFINLKGDK